MDTDDIQNPGTEGADLTNTDTAGATDGATQQIGQPQHQIDGVTNDGTATPGVATVPDPGIYPNPATPGQMSPTTTQNLPGAAPTAFQRIHLALNSGIARLQQELAQLEGLLGAHTSAVGTGDHASAATHIATARQTLSSAQRSLSNVTEANSNLKAQVDAGFDNPVEPQAIPDDAAAVDEHPTE